MEESGGLKKLNIKKAYDSDRDNLLRDFYIPMMSAGTKYKRLAGFFSSGIFSAAARGVAEFIENDGHMQLIVGVDVQEDDYAAMEKSIEFKEKYLEKNLDFDLEEFVRSEKLEALAWMLANDKLDLKIGYVPRGGLFHLKVGIMEDKYGNSISFSGSDNETPSAWKHNVEEFKVFKSWETGQEEYFNADEEKFDRFWKGKGSRAIVIDLPRALRDKIIRAVPKYKKDLKIFKKNTSRSQKNKSVGSKPLMDSIKLRKCQAEALDFWEANKNKGLLAMATGAGKTMTALMAYHNIFKKRGECLAIVAVPQLHLATQWIEDDIKKLYPDALIIEAHSQSGE